MTDRNIGTQSGFSRRAFLKGSSAVAAATALHAQAVAAADKDGKDVVSGKQQIELNVNAKKHSVQVEPRTTLLEVLRNQLELTGAKPVSLDGSSGASTVLINGKPATASTTLAIACQGKKIETVESLRQDDPVVKAFTTYDAEQCGFCTPGFVVAVRAFLNKNPQATDQQIRAGLNSNICRCGTYANIIEATNAVAKGGA